LLQNAITLITLTVVLLPFGFWLPLALILSGLPGLLVVLRHGRRHYEWKRRATEGERRLWYYEWLLTAGDPAAEMRLLGLGDHVKGTFRNLRARLRQERLGLLRQQHTAELAAGAAGLCVFLGALGVIGWRALHGQMTLGDLAMFYQAFNQSQRLMRSLLDNVRDLYAHSLFLGSLFEFLSLKPRLADPPAPVPVPAVLREGIRFQQVTFRYPGTERVALHDFDLTIPAGKMVAIVGPNGAGKSTLIKLICRLYDPEAGRIELDGTDLRDLRIADLRRAITVLFQSPVRYSETVRDNIRFGDWEASAPDADIEEAACSAGADGYIGRLPQGYQTMLGRWFGGGTELSGGEWQRLALARAFLRRAPLILLDEPTSAMDSWAEAEWLERFRALARDRTAVIITHRFTTAMRADIIHVMQEGRIVESGSHDDLLARGGIYCASWSAQVRSWTGDDLPATVPAAAGTTVGAPA
jgi:ATP-binding cassette subfamily B protein